MSEMIDYTENSDLMSLIADGSPLLKLSTEACFTQALADQQFHTGRTMFVM